jgi:hypothetical protein
MSPQRDPMGEAIWDPSPGLREQLTSEYGGRPPEKIDQVAQQALDELLRVDVR